MFLVVTVVDLNSENSLAIKEWLRVNIPDWMEFKLVPSGKYLGVWLGRGGDSQTWDSPAKKFLERTVEIADGNAPALPSILRHNERAVSVFAYVSQLYRVPQMLDALEQRGIHKMLRMPPNSMSRELMHTMELFSHKSPASLRAWCADN